jgi:hypothetical protein
MTSAELSEWMAYYMLEPFGQARQDQASRLIAGVLVNANRGDNPPVKFEELLPTWRPPADPEEVGAKILAAFDRYEAQLESMKAKEKGSS